MAEWSLSKAKGVADKNALRKQVDQDRVKSFYKLRESGKSYLRLTRPRNQSVDGKAIVTRIYSGVLHKIGESFLKCEAHCACCHILTAVPMVTPCGHPLCGNCVRSNRTKCVAQHCDEAYRLDNGYPEDLLKLQLAASSMEPWKPGWQLETSSKIAYLLGKIRALPMNEEWRPNESKPRRTRPKIVVHSQFREHLGYLVTQLKGTRDFRNSCVDLGTSPPGCEGNRRHRKAAALVQGAVEAFREQLEKHILLMNTRHLSAGLNLKFIQFIFMLEPVWTPSSELQLTSRAHRIGTKQDVYVERLVMRDWMEHMMVRDLEGKLHEQGEAVTVNSVEKVDMSCIHKILRKLKPVKGLTDGQRQEVAGGKALKRPRAADWGDEGRGAARIRNS